MTKRTVVVVTDRRLIPRKAGNTARIGLLVHGLRAAGYRVVLIAPYFRGRFSRKVPALVTTLRTRLMADRLVSVHTAPNTSGTLRYDTSMFAAALARVVKRDDPVAVIAEYAWMAPCLDAVGNGARKIVDTLDVMHSRRGIYGSVESGAWIDCTREEETEKLAHADVIIAIQRHEQRELESMLPGKRVILVPHIAWAGEEPRFRESRATAVISFLGSGNEGNYRGLESFLELGWPVVRRRRPDAVLRVYGTIAQRLGELRVPEGVHGMGVAKDLRAMYESSTILINPVQLGTGLKIKTVEAMAFGKAVVTTSCGAAGVEDGAGEAFLVEDEMSRYGDAVAGLLDDPARRRELQSRAREYARNHFSAEVALRELVAQIDSAH